MSLGYAANLETVRALAGCDQTRPVAALLDDLVTRYRDELESATGERVQALQQNIRQCKALAQVIRGAQHVEPIC